VKVAPANSARPSPSAALKSPAPVLRVSTPAPLKVASAVVPPAVAGDSTRQNGSLFSKLLSQGSLFNKLLQREPTVQDDPAETPEPEEVEPMDGISFQAASPSDWNEIRNLLTASGMQVQGALNHLNNFVLATENGRAVGAIGMEIYGDIGLVRSLVVASNMRGKAIGKRLVKHLIERARARQLSALYLLTGRVDPLFERFGFEKMARADMPTKLYVSVELQGPSSTASTGMRLFL
jgi:amino-acid N-acetyltransferase